MPRGVLSLRNLLADAEREASRGGSAIGATRAEDAVVVAWSGWLGGPDASSDGMVERDFRTWSGAGRAMLDAFVGSMPQPESGASSALWFRPHHRHVLSDAPSCAAFLKAHEALVTAGRVAMFLDAALLIDESMAGTRADHIERIVERLAPLDAIRAIAMPASDWEALDPDLGSQIERRAIPMLEPLR
ncbi:MAG: hypothetical protein H6809_01150 [Phycisphaeraceae bacterium]|nr:hypothetical protein [Phycisphaeraceae bacterium]